MRETNIKTSSIILILFMLVLTFTPALLAQAPEGEEYIVQADDWLRQGDLDSQTPPSQARAVERNLTNTTFVLFESEGHVVASKTPSCPGAIAAQFLDNPTGEIDTSCAAGFVLNFELPE